MKLTIDETFEGLTIILDVPEAALQERIGTYYLAIDTFFMKNDDGNVKVLCNLKNLFKNWLKLVEDLDCPGVIYLPYDFSDEYIGCLKVSYIESGQLDIVYGITRKITGHELYPSQLSDFTITSDDFQSLSTTFNKSKTDFLSNTNTIIKTIDYYINEYSE